MTSESAAILIEKDPAAEDFFIPYSNIKSD